MGILNNLIPFCLIVWGQTRIGSGLAAILNATTPLFTVLVAHVLTTEEKLTPKRLAGASAAMARRAARMAGGSAATGVHLSKRRKANPAAAMRDRR